VPIIWAGCAYGEGMVRRCANNMYLSDPLKYMIFQWHTLHSLKAHANPISCLSVHGKCIVSGASDHLVKVWLLNNEGDVGAQILHTLLIGYSHKSSTVK
jgi:WD40 repeat protein